MGTAASGITLNNKKFCIRKPYIHSWAHNNKHSLIEVQSPKMKEVLQYAALILGLAISFHTVYMIAYSHLLRVRERRALAEELRLKFDNVLTLAGILAGKAHRFRDKYKTEGPGNLNISSDKAREDLAIIEAQTQQVLALNPGVELSKWSRMMNKSQLARLVTFLSGYQLYHHRLEKRFDEFHASPEMWGTLARFLSCTTVTDPDLSGLFIELLQSLGKTKEKQKCENK